MPMPVSMPTPPLRSMQTRGPVLTQVALPWLDLPVAPPLAPRHTADPCTAVAQDIGRAHARYGIVPPLPHLLPGHPVREGWQAGRRALAGRRLAATPAIRLSLKLRLQAWSAGRPYDTLEVNPRYLHSLDASHCPVTRDRLTGDLDHKGEVVALDRKAAWAGGHLVLLSARAAQGCARRVAEADAAAQEDWRWAAAAAETAAEAPCAALPAAPAPLNRDEWARLATLLSFVTPLTHEAAARLPLRVLPPPRVRLLNPIQGLQALITLQLLHSDWRDRMVRLADLVSHANPGALQHFHIVFHTLLARALEGGPPTDAQALRERLEDAWSQAHLLRRWQRFALSLTSEQAASLERSAAQIGQARTRVRHHASAAHATEGWNG